MGDKAGRALLGIALVVGLVAACGNGPSDDQELVKQKFQETKVKKLPGGGKVAVGSPDGHRIVVQWQGDGAGGWSEPQTVYTEAGQFTHDIGITAEGETVAIDPDFWTEEELDDDYAPNHTAQIICRERDCAKGHRSPDGELSSTELSKDGHHASFAMEGDKVLLWDDGTFRTETVTGLPKGSSSELLPDGSSAAISPERHGKLCRYRLLTSERGAAAYVSQTVSGDYPALLPCSISGIEVAKDKVSVLIEELSDSVDFKRSGKRWAVDAPRSPLQSYPDTEGKSSILNDVANRPDDSDVSIGSPDNKRIFTQYRAPGSKEWTPPLQVATAPEGTSCRFVSSERVKLAVIATVSCYADGKPYEIGGATTPDMGIAMATADGRTWDVETLERPSLEVSYGDGNDSIFQGSKESFVWKPKGKMRRIALPSDPLRDAVAVTPDDRVMRISGNPSGDRTCRPSYQVADLDATEWPEARTMPKLGRTDADDCSASAYFSDGAYQVDVAYAWLGTIEQKGDDWVAKKSSESY